MRCSGRPHLTLVNSEQTERMKGKDGEGWRVGGREEQDQRRNRKDQSRLFGGAPNLNAFVNGKKKKKKVISRLSLISANPVSLHHIREPRGSGK